MGFLMIDFNKNVVVLLDANAYVHSSFHGYEEKKDVKGNDQRIIHGIMDTLVGLTFQLEKIDEIFMIFDPDDGSLFRESQYPAYKKNRPPTDPSLSVQRNNAKIVFRDKLGLPMVHYPGYEADDIIGSMAKILSKKNHQVVIVSPDKDIAQLVDDNVFLLRKWKTKEGKGYTLLNKEKVKEDFGVFPNQIADWLALMGDAADNLPGLYKVGKKTAANIVKKYLSVEHLLSIVHHLEDEKLKEKILESQETIPLVKRLAKIVVDLPIEEEIVNALEYSRSVRESESYKENILKIERYFNWKPHYKEMFI